MFCRGVIVSACLPHRGDQAANDSRHEIHGTVAVKLRYVRKRDVCMKWMLRAGLCAQRKGLGRFLLQRLENSRIIVEAQAPVFIDQSITSFQNAISTLR